MQKINLNINEYKTDLNANAVKIKPKISFYTIYIKRLFDIAISFIALIVFLPINIFIGIITFFDVGNPIFFTQERLGKDLKKFKIVKFRNMRDIRDKDGNLLPPDQRVTRFGSFVRRTSIDELLNFWNVFKGEMSIIGPRPLICDYLPYYDSVQIMRHSVTPGLECPSLKKRGQERTWSEQFEDDIWYVQNVSFITDCKMIFALIKLVFHKEEIKQRGKASRIRFDEECKMEQKKI